ncbi:Beta-galactosidase [Mucinivorans hirudinis]|uniref:Beta-galactosidase n=1 Tax=Mucinivorans hirudinis TaxID=1433126 RepID=A0A060RCV5_9BACT|nr:Beta-galactosidase [Mucinivorans hirudinis]
MKRLTLALLCLAFLAGAAQNINRDWQFQRIDNQTQNRAKIENQGQDWSSQYNPQVVAQSAALKVARDTLVREFAKLQDGVWQNVTLPHTAFVEEFVVLHQWQGVCYYKKRLARGPEWRDKIVLLEFGAAMQLADVWVNGEHRMQHAGGYLPFVVDLTELLKNGDNEILVRLDNRDNPLIPPGKPVAKLDFNYFSGLHRGARLIVKDKLHITHPILANKVAGGGIFVTYPEVSKEQATIDIKTNVQNSAEQSSDFVVVQKLYRIEGLFGRGVKGELVARVEQKQSVEKFADLDIRQQIVVKKPALWSPDFPNLYLLESEIKKNGKVVDSEATRLGIRRLEMSRERGFVLNGEPIRLVGSNRHSDYPYLGNAISENAGYRDIWLIKENGFNTVRLGHYPQDVAVLDACDELGVLVIEPIPGWQFFNKAPEFTARTYEDVRDMIRRDRNHPSIVMWETTLNESWPPNAWKDGAIKAAHEEYPGDQCFTAGDAYEYYGFDVSYNDWEEGFNRPNISPNPSFIREYYDYEFGGHYSTTRIGRRNGERALLQNAWNAQWSHNRYRAYYPHTMGDAVWSMYDYNRGCADNVCESGMADLFRLPKFSLPLFKSQLDVGTPLPTGNMKPYIFVANYWTERSGKDKVVVYGNVEEVELFVNGRSVGRQRCDSGADSDYSADEKGWYTGGNPFDGGNCNNLNFPPFTFNNIAWEKGELRAVGYIGGKEVVGERRVTPTEVDSLVVRHLEAGRAIGENDTVLVYVELRDKSGELCVLAEDLVRLKVEGRAEVVGENPRRAEAGVASFVVRVENPTGLKFTATR